MPIGKYEKKALQLKKGGRAFDQRNFSVAMKADVDAIGKKYGCHTCGAKKSGWSSGHFTPDHQPPIAIHKSTQPQFLYPYCKACTSVQGGQVSSVKAKGF